MTRKIVGIIIVYVLLSWIIGLLLAPFEDSLKPMLADKTASTLFAFVLFAVTLFLSFIIAKKILPIEPGSWKKIALTLISLNVVLHIVNVILFQNISYVYRNVGGGELPGIEWGTYIISLVIDSIIIYATSWLILNNKRLLGSAPIVTR